MTSGIVTAVLLLLFLFGSVWAFSPRRRQEFDEAAQLPLRDDEAPHELARQEEGSAR